MCLGNTQPVVEFLQGTGFRGAKALVQLNLKTLLFISSSNSDLYYSGGFSVQNNVFLMYRSHPPIEVPWHRRIVVNSAPPPLTTIPNRIEIK